MAINLLSIEPHKVSTDLSGYITFLYGPAKVGKTTFGTQMPGHLLLSFERGYNAIPGAMAQDITSWGEMRQIVRELKKPEVKAVYKSLIVDTADVASDYCQKYICNQLGIENMGDGGWSNNSWVKYRKEFEDVFRTLAQLGYAIVFLSHDKEKTIKPQNGTEYQQIGSSVQSTALSIIENMSDIIAYAHTKVEDGNSKTVLTLRSPDNSIRCGCRFKYIKSEIDFSYNSLVSALNDAIQKEAAETDNKYITEKPNEPTQVREFNFTSLLEEFSGEVKRIMEIDSNNAIRITQIVDKYLGKGKKVSEATPDQAELVYLIIEDLKHDIV